MRDGESKKQFIERVHANSVKARSRRNNDQPNTPLDLDLLTRLAAGQTTKQIASAHNVTHWGVYSRTEALRARHGFDTTFQLIAEAIRRGWIK